jgi:hypothetical protein
MNHNCEVNRKANLGRFPFDFRPKFFSLDQWKDLVYVSQISIENGPHSNVIKIFRHDRSEAQMFCVAFINLTVLTGLAVLMESAHIVVH